MTFTYTDPGNSSADAVRFLLADTSEVDAELTDEEIAWLLTQNGSNIYPAAIAGVDHLIATYARKATERQIGPLRLRYERKAEDLRVLRDSLVEQSRSASAPVPWAGGLSKDERDLDRDNTDLIQPRFRRGQFGNRHIDESLDVVIEEP